MITPVRYKRYVVRVCMGGQVIERITVEAVDMPTAMAEAMARNFYNTDGESLDYDEIRVVTEARVAEEQREREAANAN